jgi:hypothetical protein
MKLGGYVDVGVCSKYYKPMGEYLPFTCDIIRQAQKIQELTNESKLRFNSAIENNWLFRDTRLKRLSCPRLRKAGYCSIGHVITEQGIPRSNEVPALTYLERMEWQNINKYDLCGEPDQTIEHLFWECERVQEVKTQVAQRWGKPLGALSPGDPDFIPHLTARFLHVVYVENITADSLGVEQVIGSINLALDVERVISDKAGKLDAFIGLWGEVHRREE